MSVFLNKKLSYLILGFVLGVLFISVFFSNNLQPYWLTKLHLEREGFTRLQRGAVKHIRLTRVLLDPMTQSLENKMRQVIQDKLIQTASIQFTDLDTGFKFNINGRGLYNPASLMKVPLLIAWLKRLEEDLVIWDQTFVYRGEHPGDDSLLKFGETYELKYLFEIMIVDSDNGAAMLLLDKIPKDYLIGIQEDMSIFMTDPSMEGSYSVIDFSTIFQCLYNGTYLDENNSRYALKLMSQCHYEHGIRSAVPPEIQVSHKFGIRRAKAPANLHQLHHAAIIYHPMKTYMLIIMTRGKDIGQLEKTTRDLTSIVHEQVSSHVER